MKKLLFLLLPLLLCGCTHDMNRKEIDELNLVLVLGIDYSEGEYTLSALSSNGAGADPEKGAGSGEENLAQGKGKTAYEALENLKLKEKKSLSLAQAGAFLIGEEAAKNGLDKSLDFLSRDETIKMEGLIYTIKENKAADFIKKGIKNKQSVHEDLQAIQQKQKESLTRSDNTVVNLLNDMKQTNSSVLIPYMTSEESGFLMDGYAVYEDLKLVDYLDHDTADGVNFIKNIMRSYPIYLKDEVSLEISYTKTRLKADLKNKGITVTIKVDFETMIKEILTKEDIFNQETLLRLTKEQNDYITNTLQKPVNYSLVTGRDILGLAREIENQNTVGWKDIEADWNTKISGITYYFDVNSQITKSFILGNER